MTRTTTPSIRRGTGRTTEPRGSYGATALLIGSPLIMVAGRALLVPMDDQDWDGVMTSMVEHQARSDGGWLLALAASGLLAVTAVALARRIDAAGRARAALFVTVSTALGWAGCAAICLGGLYLSVAADAPDRAAQVAIQEQFNDGSSGVVFLMCLVAAVGYVVLAVGLARSKVVPTGVAVLIGLGGAATLLTMAGPITGLLVTAALVLTAGHALAARAQA